MPELPEVETIRRGLNRFLPGLIVKQVTSDNPKSFPNSPSLVKRYLLGAKIETISRRAKVLILELNNDYVLLIHLKMTGQLVYIGENRWGGGHPTDSLINPLPDRSTRVTFEFADKSKLYFNDQRKFGWIRLIPKLEIPEIDFFHKLGPEPFGTDFSWQYFKTALMRRKNTTIKAAILDQSIVAGVGNIYADESLYAAKIHPASKVSELSQPALKRLWLAIPKVLQVAIDNGGSTYRNYIDVNGAKGQYLAKYGKVFRREGQPCLRCGTIIAKTRVAGRGTHFCPKCQKI